MESHVINSNIGYQSIQIGGYEACGKIVGRLQPAIFRDHADARKPRGIAPPDRGFRTKTSHFIK